MGKSLTKRNLLDLCLEKAAMVLMKTLYHIVPIADTYHTVTWPISSCNVACYQGGESPLSTSLSYNGIHESFVWYEPYHHAMWHGLKIGQL